MRQWSVAVSLLACVFGCGGSGPTNDPAETGALADVGDVADVGSASDASGVSDAGTADTGDTFDAADTQDAADALDASDTQDVADTLDATDTQDAADTLDVADTQDAADTLDAGDVTDADVADDAGPPAPEAPPWVKLVNPLGGDSSWYDGASFGRSAAMEGDLYVVGADEDNQRGQKAGAILIGTRIDGAWVSERVAPVSLTERSRFGASVAISDGVIAVGARNDSRWGELAGQVWILERRFGAWSVTQQVASPVPEPLERFGSAVALDGDTLVVSSNSDEIEQGKVHIFRRDVDEGFVHVVTHLSGRDNDTSLFGSQLALEGDTLAVSDIEGEAVWLFSAPFTEAPARLESETSSAFGTALDINEGWLLVGASSGPTGGSALAYRRVDTGVSATPVEITVDGLDSGASFGAAVALDGDTALIGAFRAAVFADRAGAAYRFALSEDGFEELEVLTPDTLSVGDRFGFAVASDGGDAVVTSIGDDSFADASGASYRYTFSTEELPGSVREFCGTVTTDDRFGAAVATAGDTIFVGVSGDDEDAEDAGAILVFRAFEGSYRYVQRLERPDTEEGQELGTSIALDGDWLAAGAPGDARDGEDAGAVVVWQNVDGKWTYHATVRPFGGVPGGRYGTAVDFDGGRLIVGAEFRSDELGFGGAFLHRRADDIWAFVSRIDAVSLDLRPPSDADVGYGRAVAIEGDQLFVGIPGDTDDLGGTVAQLIYDGGPLAALLPFGIAEEGAEFGGAIAAEGGEVLVGAPGADSVFTLAPGGATSFPMLAVSGEAGSRFGGAIALSGERAAVGAIEANERTGSVSLLERTEGTWSVAATYSAEDGRLGDELGASVAVTQGAPRAAVIAGAPGDDERGGNAGAVYVFFE